MEYCPAKRANRGVGAYALKDIKKLHCRLKFAGIFMANTIGNHYQNNSIDQWEKAANSGGEVRFKEGNLCHAKRPLFGKKFGLFENKSKSNQRISDRQYSVNTFKEDIKSAYVGKLPERMLNKIFDSAQLDTRKGLQGRQVKMVISKAEELSKNFEFICGQTPFSELQHHEVQEAAYQMAAKLNGNPIEEHEYRCLVDANQTMHDTRLALKHGRGNIEADIKPSGGFNEIGSGVVYKADWNRLGMAITVGAGFCDQHASINANAHSQKIGPGEKTRTVGAEITLPGLADSGHAWAETDAVPKNGSNPTPIVMDSWANGPAARYEDTFLASHPRDSLTVTDEQDKEGGKKMLAIMHEYKHNNLKDGVYADSIINMVRNRVKYPPRERDEGKEVQVINKEFAETAKEKLGKMLPLHKEIIAAGTAREAYGLSIAQATKSETIKPIIREAGRLDQQERPPVTQPDFWSSFEK